MEGQEGDGGRWRYHLGEVHRIVFRKVISQVHGESDGIEISGA